MSGDNFGSTETKPKLAGEETDLAAQSCTSTTLSQRHSAPRPAPFPQELPPATAARESSGSGREPSSLRPATEPPQLAREPYVLPSTRGGSQVPRDEIVSNFDRVGTVWVEFCKLPTFHQRPLKNPSTNWYVSKTSITDIAGT
jgi:hypothetical protein